MNAALVTTVAALVDTFRSPDLLLIALLYAAAFAAAVIGIRLGKKARVKESGRHRSAERMRPHRHFRWNSAIP